MKTSLVSVICPIFNEEKHIQHCVESMLAQDYPKDKLEIFFIDGMSSDKTRVILSPYLHKFPNIHLLENPHKVVPYALNIGIKASKGDVIVRIDGHCKYPTNYISTLVHYLFKLDADNVGGLWNTTPANSSSMCKTIAYASSHPFGVGGSKHKIGTNKITQTDTVPFGCYHRDIFNKIGFFDEDLIRNQDDEFNGRLIKNGGKIFLIPSLIITYIARESLSKMAKMYYQYGLFKPLVNKKLGSPATIRQFFPPLFLIGIIVGAIMSCIYNPISTLYFGVLLLYFLITIAIGFRALFKGQELIQIFLFPIVFLIIHLSYGLGYIVGIIKILCGQKINVQSSR